MRFRAVDLPSTIITPNLHRSVPELELQRGYRHPIKPHRQKFSILLKDNRHEVLLITGRPTPSIPQSQWDQPPIRRVQNFN